MELNFYFSRHRNSPVHQRERRPRRAARGTRPTANLRPPRRPHSTPPSVPRPPLPSSPEGRSAILQEGIRRNWRERGCFPEGTTLLAIQVPGKSSPRDTRAPTTKNTLGNDPGHASTCLGREEDRIQTKIKDKPSREAREANQESFAI